VSRCKRDPLFFLTEVLGSKLVTPDQRRVIDSVAANRRTAVP